MANAPRNLVLRYIRRVAGMAGLGDASDADLLGRFLAHRDEAAFELLLWRHGTMVLHVCRDVARDEHAAEDAFQATFLALVRKATSIRARESIGAWLYRVAFRAALRVRRSKRETVNVNLAELPDVAELPDEASLRELRPLLHEEVQRLPGKYRTPIVLCYLEGLTHEEAARQLGWPKGTVAGRVARARELLRKRLTRRGISLPVALSALALAPGAVLATVPAALVQTTLRAGLLVAAGESAAAFVSAQVLALSQGVIRTMFWHNVRISAAVILALGLVGSGVGLYASGRLTAQAGTTAQADEDDDAPKATESKRQQKAEKIVADDARAIRKARQQSVENLKLIALGMHNHHEVYGFFPAAAIYSKDGKPLLSWRVALLPFFEEDNLYRQFHLDEPWDSAHNKKLLARMPKVFSVPGQKDKNATFYQVFVGPSTMFERRGGGGGKGGATGGGSAPAGGGAGTPGGGGGVATGAVPGAGGPGGGSAATGTSAAGGQVGTPRAAQFAGMRISDIVDGASNTIMVIEGGSAVPWTKPEDLPFTPPNLIAENPIVRIPPLGGPFGDVIHAAFADGSLLTIKKNFDKVTMAAAITRNGGEVFDPAKLTGPSPGASPKELKEENEQLQKDVEEVRAELEELKELLQKTKLERQRRAEEEEAGERLRIERQKLRAELDALREEARRLRQEIERLQGVNEKTPKRN
jgi:RNA polymerase sigma factor (sigma-70 family)